MKCPISDCNFTNQSDAIYCDCGYYFQENDTTNIITKDSLLQINQPQEHWNAADTRILKYTVEISHKGLNDHKLISAPEPEMLENKANLQIEKWKEKWKKLELKRSITKEKEANLDEAKMKSEEARKAIEQIDNLLVHTLSIDDTVDWECLKQNKSFPEKKPSRPSIPSKKDYKKYPTQPDKNSDEFIPKFTFFDKLSKSKKELKSQECENNYIKATSEWEEQKRSTDTYNKDIDNEHESKVKRFEEEWDGKVTEWEKRKSTFLEKQKVFNIKIDEMKQSYLAKDLNSIIEYCEMVLNNSEYPESFTINYELEYNPENKILIIEYQLPPLECFPNVKEVKCIAARKELIESYISESQLNKMFDEGMYKITLRTIHEIFEADSVNAIDAISFNGWVESINKATGKNENNCILSIQVKKDEFLEIDLSRIDPKICFKNLKGVASSKLSSLTPIQPILQMSKSDKRFVEGYDVADTIDNSTNLAAMDWEDFEHLIRELFEKEFQSNGGEVKVTQASKDGGVDAIAFDPDPIRGGKIVIQAKRYTNTVGVAAVRDLYGTVVNEGATKGILVSTADYGPDAYQFAKDKPLTLMNGSNLLHLLERHGHHAKIDMREAKKILAEKEKNS
jgi:restriction system protein